MRRVPQYLIIGNGRMATHMCAYFAYLNISYKQWNRRQHSISTLQQLVLQSSHVLMLISDSAIDDFIKQHLQQYSHITRVHFSGSLNAELAYSAHPLCSFQRGRVYTFDEYQQIPFVIEAGSPELSELIPGLSNPSYQFKKADKAYYHSMCVLANNFSTLLWEKFFIEMQQRFDIDKKHLLPILEKTFSNIARFPDIEMTGPLTRGDASSLERNLIALKDDPFHLIFKSFIDTFVEATDEHC